MSLSDTDFDAPTATCSSDDVCRMPDADLPMFTPLVQPKLKSIEDLMAICRTYMKDADLARVEHAYDVAFRAHDGQTRKSGEPYITHPIAVACVLAEWHLDVETVQAGLMHDVLEDTGVTKAEMAEDFGIEVANLVDGVSKLDKLSFSSAQAAQAESFQKMFIAMARDVRVILIKLADRLHNLRTLGIMRAEKRARIAKETLDIFVPLAHRLGINGLFRELQELSFANRHPLRYEVIYEHVLQERHRRRALLEKILHETKQFLPKHGIKARIIGRDKTIYGIYNKMRQNHQSLSDALDIYGFRIVVGTREECYQTLGVLHRLYKPVHRRFKDFIAIPKSNGYQGIHTTVIGPKGTPVEYQIRTESMHRVAEYGILSQWLFTKEEDSTDMRDRIATWLQQLMDIQKTSADSTEFLENIKIDLFPNRLYAFTPGGRIISLPKGSTPIDFAYQVHSHIGDHAYGSKINGEIVPLSTTIKNGDMVEILVSDDAHPHPEWLEFVHSGRARAEIRQYLRNSKFDDALKAGHDALYSLAEKRGVKLEDIPDEDWAVLLKEFELADRHALYAAIGLGKDLPAAVFARLLKIYQPVPDETLPGILIRGDEGVAVNLCHCCHPIPGDRAVGFSRKGHGLDVHRSECMHAKRGIQREPARWLRVDWNEKEASGQYAVPIAIKTTDAAASVGIITTTVATLHSNIVGFDFGNNNEVVVLVQVHNNQHLIQVMHALEKVPSLSYVKRLMDCPV